MFRVATSDDPNREDLLAGKERIGNLCAVPPSGYTPMRQSGQRKRARSPDVQLQSIWQSVSGRRG